MNHLLRRLAPISDLAWQMLDQEATDRLAPALGARRLVDFSGPHGWEHSATNLGRTSPLDSAPSDGVSGVQRRVLPLVELRADFTLSRDELRAADRGADDSDLAALDDAAHELAVAENTAVFQGWPGAFGGVADSSPNEALAHGGSPTDYPDAVAGAIERLLGSGVAGPYGLALSSEHYRLVLGGAERGGYPVEKHLRKILGGPVVWTPGVAGAVVLSLRGGDFTLDCGQDISIGYADHDAEHIRLYLQESLSFHVATPEAAVVLTA